MSEKSYIYEICVDSHVDASHLSLFEDLTVTHLDNGETVIRGSIRDRAALQGLLNYLSGLGLTLIAVNRLPNDENNP